MDTRQAPHAIRGYVEFEEAAKAVDDAERHVAHLRALAQEAAARLPGRFPLTEVAKRANLSRGLIYHALTYEKESPAPVLHAIAQAARAVAEQRLQEGFSAPASEEAYTRRSKPVRKSHHDATVRAAFLATHMETR
jgi:DNA-binding phage protein